MVAPNTSIHRPSYVAILKAKQAELHAVRETRADYFIPLLEVVDPVKVSGIARAWPLVAHVAWVQPINRSGMEAQKWAERVVDMFDSLRTAGSAVVPVVTLDEAEEACLGARQLITEDRRGMVLRIDCEEVLGRSHADVLAAIKRVLIRCGCAVTDCDLVIDAGLVDGGAAAQSGAVIAALAVLPHLMSWRNVVAAFSGFPKSIATHVEQSTVGAIPRSDAAAFRLLVTRWSERLLTYSDYAVGVPTYADVPWSPIPNIRYALREEWLVHRAVTKNNPSPQYVQLARNVAAAPYFAGRNFSAGDRYIEDVATGADGPGNPTTHLKAAMSRHFHVVLDALANYGVP
ncbi:MAG TPA: hypothetical protein VE172_11170 [Stackebrandtia sp.]|uniref:beta family protein n=1 Tax=Stackebrandtia sp. TaxID=2023065 RepID=UPI002D6647A7|nr:hypothetical protein [Stackebrandtia sp.]HZE39361.1 hypothetical protein [Stackebrandtia sp.]